MSRTLFSGMQSAIVRMVMVAVVLTVFLNVRASPDGCLAEEKRSDETVAKTSKQRTLAIEVFVDLSLGLCDEQAAKKRLETLNVKNLKAALEEEIAELKSDLVGIRQVTGKQFVAITRSMDIVSSGMSVSPLGASRDRAYMEVNIFLTSQHRYVAVVTTELAELPEKIVKKLKQ